MEESLKATLIFPHKAEPQALINTGKDQKKREKQRAKCLVLALLKRNPSDPGWSLY